MSRTTFHEKSLKLNQDDTVKFGKVSRNKAPATTTPRCTWIQTLDSDALFEITKWFTARTAKRRIKLKHSGRLRVDRHFDSRLSWPRVRASQCRTLPTFQIRLYAPCGPRSRIISAAHIRESLSIWLNASTDAQMLPANYLHTPNCAYRIHLVCKAWFVSLLHTINSKPLEINSHSEPREQTRHSCPHGSNYRNRPERPSCP